MVTTAATASSVARSWIAWGLNAPIYTLDLLLPVIDFGQQNAFALTGVHQWLSYLLITVGWVLATTIAAGITRPLSRQ